MTTESVQPPPLIGAEARRAARNAGAIAAATLFSRGLQFAWQLILVPGLGPALYGIYAAVSAFVQVGTSIAAFGMGPILIRDVARHPEQAGRYLTSALFLQTFLALMGYVILNAAAAMGGYAEPVRVFLAIAGINLIIDTLGNICNDLLLARERMVATSAVTVGHMLALITLAALGLNSGYGLFGLYVGVMTAGALRVVALWVLAWRAGIRPAWPLDRRVARPLLLNSAPLAFSAFLTLAYQQLDKLLTNRLIGNAETGYLSAAFIIIFGVVELLSTTLITALYPLMSRASADTRSDQFGFMVQKVTFFTFLICLPVALTLTVFAAPLTVPLFGDDYRPSAIILSVLIWYALAMMTGNVISHAMLAQNRQRRLLFLRITGLFINAVLLLVFLPRFGVVGAPFASVCAELYVLLSLLILFRAPGWSLRRFGLQAGRLVGAGAVAALVMVALRDTALVGIPAGLLAYVGAGLLLRALATDDWDLLYRLTGALPGGHLIRRIWKRDLHTDWAGG
jgi:O-antigen/teichoic acid export membrane protein